MPDTPIPPGAATLAATMIRHFEGFRAAPYWDSYGHCWSIGYGFCTLLDGSPVTARTPALPSAACDALLESKLRQSYMPGVLTWCAGIALKDPQLAALTSFAWNLGVGTIGKAGLPALLKAGNLAGAAAVMNRYVMAGGVKLPGLVTRRAEEAAVLCGAAWPLTHVTHPLPAAQDPPARARVDDDGTEAANQASLAAARAMAPHP